MYFETRATARKTKLEEILRGNGKKRYNDRYFWNNCISQ